MSGDGFADGSLAALSCRDMLAGPILPSHRPSIKVQMPDIAILEKPKPPTKVESYDRPVPGGLREQPTEILVEILKKITSFDALYNLLHLLPAGQDILARFGKDILNAVFETSRHDELSTQIYVVMNLRNCYPHLPYLTRRFIREIVKPNELSYYTNRLYDYFNDHTMDMLRDVSELSTEIEGLVKSFARSRIAVPSMEPHDSISQKELCRIRRAFWRFQQCYELSESKEAEPALADSYYYPSRSTSSPRFVWFQTSSARGPRLSQIWLNGRGESTREPELGKFLKTLSIWEIAEFEAVRFHLASVLNALQYEHFTAGVDHTNSQPVLIQRLMYDLRNRNLNGTEQYDHALVADLRMVNHPAKVEKYWPANGDANFANTTQRARLSARYESKDEHWGWCMWDEERLIRRCLLLEPGPKASLAYDECDAARDTFIYKWVTEKWKQEVDLAKEIERRQRETDRKEREAAEAAERRWEKERQSNHLKGWIKKLDLETYNVWIKASKKLAYHPDDKEAEQIVERCHTTALRMKQIEGDNNDSANPRRNPRKLPIRSALRPPRTNRISPPFLY